jgi:hypothetical protein
MRATRLGFPQRRLTLGHNSALTCRLGYLMRPLSLGLPGRCRTFSPFDPLEERGDHAGRRLVAMLPSRCQRQLKAGAWLVCGGLSCSLWLPIPRDLLVEERLLVRQKLSGLFPDLRADELLLAHWWGVEIAGAITAAKCRRISGRATGRQVVRIIDVVAAIHEKVPAMYNVPLCQDRKSGLSTVHVPPS